MQIAARQSFLTSRAGPPLPYDAEVEYIEGTGTQYALYSRSITLGAEYEFETRVACFNPQTSPYSGFGATGRYTRQAFLAFNVASGAYMAIAYTPTNDFGKHLVADATIPHVYKAQLSNGTVSYFADGVLKHTAPNGSGFTITSFGLFKMRDIVSGTIWVENALKGRIYYCTLRNGTSTEFDFIPVRVGSGSSAVGYMYDRANPTGGPLGNGLYPNAGTGAFVIGPDK